MTDTILWAKAPSGRIIDIPILGVCGEFGSGKTLFGASIAPGNHPEGYQYREEVRRIIRGRYASDEKIVEFVEKLNAEMQEMDFEDSVHKMREYFETIRDTLNGQKYRELYRHSILKLAEVM